MTADTDKASTVLREFMSEMKGWENKFATLYKRENGGPEAHSSQAKIELEQIYDKYVTKRDRKYGRMASASGGYSGPSIYGHTPYTSSSADSRS